MTPPLVLIEWEDACLRDVGAWVDNEPIAYEPKLFVQVGFLLSDTDAGVIITSAWSPDKIAPRDQIPAGMIRRKVFLKGGRA